MCKKREQGHLKPNSLFSFVNHNYGVKCLNIFKHFTLIQR
jgi:hypothetical protein